MTVLSCTEQDLNGARSYDESLDQGYVGQRTFLVVCDTETDEEQQVLFGAQSVGPDLLPPLFSLWPGTDFTKAHHRSPSRVEGDRTKWLVKVDYKTVFSQQEVDRSVIVNPLNRPCIISGGSRTVMRAVRVCYRTLPYNTWPPADWEADEGGGAGRYRMATAVNSAGDPLDPPIDFPSTEWHLHCEKNLAGLPDWYFTHQDGVNNAVQTISINGQAQTIRSRCGKLSNITFSPPQQENGYSFITLGWDVTIRSPRDPILNEVIVPSPWIEERLDEGTRTWNGTRWKILLDESNSATLGAPIPFDGEGQPINTTGAPIKEDDLQRVGYLPCKFVDYGVMPWT